MKMYEVMTERRGIPAQEAARVKGACIVKPIVYGNTAKSFGKKREEDNHTHSWTLYVKPYHNEDMSKYVRKVVFKLHESYVNHTRVVNDPPYEIKESGWGEFEATIKIFFIDPAERHVTFYHILKLFNTDPSIIAGKKPLVSEFYDEIVFQEPTQTMYNLLHTSRVPKIGPHDTDFENKRERTLKSLNSARDEVRAELSDLKECLKEAQELMHKFKDDLNKAEKETTASVPGSSASTPPSSTTPGSTSQQEPSTSFGAFSHAA